MPNSDIKPLVEFLNLLEGLKNLLGEKEFRRRYPELDIADKVKARIRSELKKGVKNEAESPCQTP